MYFHEIFMFFKQNSRSAMFLIGRESKSQPRLSKNTASINHRSSKIYSENHFFRIKNEKYFQFFEQIRKFSSFPAPSKKVPVLRHFLIATIASPSQNKTKT